MEAEMNAEITIRPLDGGDGAALLRLAERDSAPVPAGRLLGAWLDRELVAVRSLTRGEAIADPFRPTDQIARLLERRAKQLRAERRWRRRRRRLGRRSRAALPGSPPGAGGRTLVLQQRQPSRGLAA